MVAHLTDAIRMATGELVVRPKRGPLRLWPLNVLVMFYLPWPKGAPTAPELLQRTPDGWESGVAELKATVAMIVAQGPTRSWAAHPAFGALNGEQWGRLIYRHIDHHLGQFGV